MPCEQLLDEGVLRSGWRGCLQMGARSEVTVVLQRAELGPEWMLGGSVQLTAGGTFSQ